MPNTGLAYNNTMYDTMFNTGSLNRNEHFDDTTMSMSEIPNIYEQAMINNYPNAYTGLPESYVMGEMPQLRRNYRSKSKAKRKYDSTLITLLIVVIVVIVVMYNN